MYNTVAPPKRTDPVRGKATVEDRDHTSSGLELCKALIDNGLRIKITTCRDSPATDLKPQCGQCQTQHGNRLNSMRGTKHGRGERAFASRGPLGNLRSQGKFDRARDVLRNTCT